MLLVINLNVRGHSLWGITCTWHIIPTCYIYHNQGCPQSIVMMLLFLILPHPQDLLTRRVWTCPFYSTPWQSMCKRSKLLGHTGPWMVCLVMCSGRRPCTFWLNKYWCVYGWETWTLERGLRLPEILGYLELWAAMANESTKGLVLLLTWRQSGNFLPVFVVHLSCLTHISSQPSAWQTAFCHLWLTALGWFHVPQFRDFDLWSF